MQRNDHERDLDPAVAGPAAADPAADVESEESPVARSTDRGEQWRVVLAFEQQRRATARHADS